MSSNYPILYSFRRCPYAMRARIALLHNHIPVILREINLKDKHPIFLQTSLKGTVPVLVLDDQTIIDESLAIVDYAFGHNQASYHTHPLYQSIGSSFTSAVTRLKYHERYTEEEVLQAKQDAHAFLSTLEACLAKQSHIEGAKLGPLDTIVFPFVRQLYRSDDQAFMALPFPHTQHWMHAIIESKLFEAVMLRTKVWQEGEAPAVLQALSN